MKPGDGHRKKSLENDEVGRRKELLHLNVSISGMHNRVPESAAAIYDAMQLSAPVLNPPAFFSKLQNILGLEGSRVSTAQKSNCCENAICGVSFRPVSSR